LNIYEVIVQIVTANKRR